MITFEFNPNQGDIHTRRRAVSDIYYYLINLSELAEKSEKSFEVKFSEIKESKSNMQTRGVHLLCARLMPHLSLEHKAQYALQDVKEYVKREFGYMREPTLFEAKIMLKSVTTPLSKEERKEALEFCKKIKQPKSFANATKEEMIDLITQITAWAAEKGWSDVFLESAELAALVKYYDNLNK